MVQRFLSIPAVAQVWVDGEVFYVAETAEIPIGDDAYRGLVLQDDIVVKVRLGVCITAQRLQLPVFFRGNDATISFSI